MMVKIKDSLSVHKLTSCQFSTSIAVGNEDFHFGGQAKLVGWGPDKSGLSKGVLFAEIPV